MHIILTHEQADFDAIASQFGAYLLDDTAIPVLPRRMNRNVNAFITLYGVELPFVDPRDLPVEQIQSVTLVDTQSMVSLKGMDAKTSVQVIDHHPLRDNLPPQWQVTIDETGANTTLFIEALGARDNVLTPIQATLLLLGIYEDTGSLTYSRTTARDLTAAAFLLEHGANLEIASDFLNHPLSIQQQSLYDELCNVAQSHNIHGHTVVVIGIVTRTDLLKTLTREPQLPGRQNLADRLETALPSARLALLKTVAETAYAQRAALYIVGGFVRDLLLDRPSLDFDLVVEGDAVALAQTLADRYGGRVTSHARFGTAKWHIADSRAKLAASLTKQPLDTNESTVDPSNLPESLDLITARTEFYSHPSALPTVERGSIKLDLHRRDFTINTMALRLDGHHYGELIDSWGGLNDLRQRLVRVLHSLSFVDDPTRMLRAVRFEKRFGFQIESRTLVLLRQARPMLARVSGDRIRHEIDHILSEPNICQMMARLNELELFSIIHKSLTWDDWICSHIDAIPQGKPPDHWGIAISRDGNADSSGLNQTLAYIFWLIRLSVTQVRSINARLKVSRNLVINSVAACRLRRDLPSFVDVSVSQAVNRLDSVPPIALYAVYLACDDTYQQQILINFVKSWQHITPTIDGHTLRERGLPPSPDYRVILRTLRDAWLDGKINSTKDEADLLEELIADLTQEKHD
jgi:tRNA nucleotidyltransferase/poly(A) polymerase